MKNTDSRRRGSSRRHFQAMPKISHKQLDYKDIDILEAFIMDSGRISTSRTTRVSKLLQRKVRKAIERARFVGLFPYCDRHKHI